MYMLMSFVGAVGSLIGESGLAEVMNAGFSTKCKSSAYTSGGAIEKDHPGQQSGKLCCT